MHLTVSDLISKVRELAAASPDCRYRSTNGSSSGCCNNRGECTNGTVGCIIGQAAAALGYDWGDEPSREGVHLFVNRVFRHTPRPQTYWLDLVQGQQDLGKTWGDAVQYADEQVSRYKLCDAV